MKPDPERRASEKLRIRRRKERFFMNKPLNCFATASSFPCVETRMHTAKKRIPREKNPHDLFFIFPL